MDYDFLTALLDEVALEGLDGITLSMLWYRLGNRPHFPITLDDESKAFLWECVTIQRDIEIFELPSERPFIPVYNRYDFIDSELGIVLENPEKPVDLYPVVFVNDGNVRGSCATYSTRVSITSEIKYDDVLLMPLNQVKEKWGDKLVLVASPKLRLLSLIGTETNPNLEMSQEEYCLLERIGRSRYLGEVTQGESGLLSLKAPFCKQLHYYRKKLTLKGLVTKQLHYMKNIKGQATTGSLFHLTRFYVQRKTKMELLMKCMCDILKEKPLKRESTKVLREEMQIKENTFKKLFYRPFQKWVKMMTIPYKDFAPNATQKEKFTTNGQEKLVKVVQLLRHCDDFDMIEDEEVNDEREHFLPLNVHFDCAKLCYNESLTSQIYKIILQAGPEGLTSAAIGRIITLPRLDVRTFLKILIKKDYVVTVLQERGRQKETMYIAKKFILQNETYSKVKEREQELNLKKEVLEESNKNKSSKRKHSESPESTDKPASKKVRFNDETNVIVFEGNNVNAEEESFKEINFQKIVSEVTEIQERDEFTGKSPKLVSLSEKVINPKVVGSICQLTNRKLIRMETVLQNLKSTRLTTLTDLQKYLIDKEKEEGYNFKIDKKSTARMVQKLCSLKKLKIFKAVLTLDDQKAELEFICDNSVNLDDPCVEMAIEQAKFKFFSTYKEKNKSSEATVIRSTYLDDEKPVIEENHSEKKKILSKALSLSDKRFCDFQTHPKFLRLKTLHKFLFYLVHNYEGHPTDIPKKPVVYHDSMTWKRFVAPLPIEKQNKLKEGWCYLADIYNRMPLSIFVKVMNLRHKIKEFVEYLADEEKCHYLITYLPHELLNSLLSNRRYLFAFDDVLKALCYLGLVSFGPQAGKQKEQVHIYVHKKAAIKDTTISTPGYIHINNELTYEKRIFNLNTLDDVEKFWIELESVSVHTPLGKYSSMAGKTIAIAEASHKPELLESIKNKNFNEVVDIGHIPGDGLGAGGFDSSLYLHSRRNWQHSNTVKSNEKENKSRGKKNFVNSIQNLLKNNETLSPDGRNRLQRLNRYRVSQKDKNAKENKSLKENAAKKSKSEPSSKKSKGEVPKYTDPPPIVSRKRKRIKFRTVKMRNKKVRQPYLDEKDKAAMQRMSRSRVEWLAQEDSFLLLCKVASSFLDRNSRTLVVPYTVVRDLLHEKFPEISRNKTSRACQRRVRYMMLNNTTSNNVAVFLGEARQDKDLVKEFDKVKPVKTNEAVWKELFTGVLKRLLEKFTLPASDRCQNISLPNTVDEFKQKFEILSPHNVFHRKNNHKDPETEDEVRNSMLYSLIVSAMAVVQDGTEWSYLLHKLYQSHPEYVLRSIVSRLRSEKVIAVKKRTCKKDLQRPLISTTTFPYRFSITYENTMITKFPIKLFNESKELIDVLKYKSSEDDVEIKGNVAPGYAAAILALVSLNELQLVVKIPEQVILFDTTLSEEARSNIVERMLNTLSDEESIELSRLLTNGKDSPASDKKKDPVFLKSSKDISSDQSENVSIKKIENDTFQTTEVQKSTNASRFALYLLRQELSQPPIERVQHSQDYIVLNSCTVFCNLKPNVNASSSDVTIGQNSSHSKISEPRAKILTDGCISEIKESLTTYIPPEAFTERNFDESLEKIYDAYSPQTLNDAKCIFEEILKANVTGISEKNIWKKFRVLNGELSLFEHLHLFKEALLVLRAGVASFVYVCMCYARNWVLTSYLMPEICYEKKNVIEDTANLNTSANDDSEEMDVQECVESSGIDEISAKEKNISKTLRSIVSADDISSPNLSLQNPVINFSEEVHFLPRTWRNPDGTLNKTSFVELLQTILSYIISSPGVNTSRVAERFSLALQPVQTLELLEILEKACCISKYYTRKHSKKTLFSKFIDISITKNPNPEDMDHLEPLPDAVCNLARIQEAII